MTERDRPHDLVQGAVQVMDHFADVDAPLARWVPVDVADPADFARRFKGGCVVLDGCTEWIRIEESLDFAVEEIQMLVDAI